MDTRRTRLAILIAALVAIGSVTAAPVALAAEPASPMIVVLERDADVEAAVSRGKKLHRVKPSHTFRYAARGYAAELTRGQARAIEKDRGVMAVVPDSVVELAAQSVPFGVRRVGATKSPLTHIDGADLASHRVNADVAIIDTGIQSDHPDLRVVGGYDCSRPGTPTNERTWPSRWRDDHGHGTHVAGIVGALDNGRGVVGVAPGARLWSVKVFDSTGFSRISWIACGIDWVTSKRDPNNTSRPLIEVANMSLRDPGSDDGNCGYTVADIEHQAICRSTSRGTTYVVAAGNDASSAARWRPGSYNEVITVSAMADFDGKPGGLASATCTSFGTRDSDDTFANFSNYGGDVDITAPGVCVRSTVRGSGYGTISGTSMATPHVAGAAALFKAAHPTAAPSDVRAALRAAGSWDWRTSTDPDSADDPLLDVSSFGAGAGLRIRSATTTARLLPGGSSATVRYDLSRLDGQHGTVSMSVGGLPAGVTASIARTTWSGREFGFSSVSLKAAADAPAFDGKVSIVARAGDLRAEHAFRLVVVRDDAAPVVDTVKERMVVPSTVTATGIGVRTDWTISDAGSGMASSTLGERRDGGDWKVVATTGSTVRSRAVRLPLGVALQHRVRATDAAGNVGAYLEGPVTTFTSYSEGTSLATWSSGWSSIPTAGALGGRMRYSTKAGASVTFTFEGRGVGWVSTTASNRGLARVYVDGVHLTTIDLGRAAKYAQLVFTRELPAGRHTLKVEVRGTSGRPRVDVDGFIVER